MKALLSFYPKPIEQWDNHRPGCWDTNLMTAQQKG
jgi:hypothetical protein